jgi:hypothetical protein
MDISPERVPLRQLLDYVDATFRPLTTEKSLGFHITTATGVPADLLTDDSRLRQILRNLVSNAVKFTEHGSVELRIELADSEQLPASVRRHGVVARAVLQPAGQRLQVLRKRAVLPFGRLAVRPVCQQRPHGRRQSIAMAHSRRRRTTRDAAVFVGVRIRLGHVVFELVMEAHVVHLLEHIVVVSVDPNRLTAAAASGRGVCFSHTEILPAAVAQPSP